MILAKPFCTSSQRGRRVLVITVDRQAMRGKKDQAIRASFQLVTSMMTSTANKSSRTYEKRRTPNWTYQRTASTSWVALDMS